MSLPVARLAALLRWAIIAAALLALEFACRSGAIPAATLIAPSEMLGSLASMLCGGAFDRDILLTASEVLSAALLAIAGGIAAGSLVHAVPPLRAAVEPLLPSFYAVPSFMLYPLFIVLFGVGPAAIVAIATLLAVVAMVGATLTGLDRVPPVLRRTARVLGMGRLATAWRVVLPAALPHLFTGVKLAVGYAFIGVIASEFILSGAGLGYRMAYAYNNFDNRAMYGLMLLILVGVTLVNGALAAIDRRLQARRG